MGTEIVMETSRLRLRHWNSSYRELLDQHCNNDAVLAHLGGRMSTAEHTELVPWLSDQQSDYGMTFWAVEQKDNDEFLGFCGLVKVDEPDSTVLGATEIGWRFRADRHREGLGFEAASACMYYAFEENGDGSSFRNVCDGLRVVSRTAEANRPSWGLMEKLGMRHDARLDYHSRKGGEAHIVYVMTYTDWHKARVRLPDPRVG